MQGWHLQFIGMQSNAHHSFFSHYTTWSGGTCGRPLAGARGAAGGPGPPPARPQGGRPGRARTGRRRPPAEPGRPGRAEGTAGPGPASGDQRPAGKAARGKPRAAKPKTNGRSPLAQKASRQRSKQRKPAGRPGSITADRAQGVARQHQATATRAGRQAMQARESARANSRAASKQLRPAGRPGSQAATAKRTCSDSPPANTFRPPPSPVPPCHRGRRHPTKIVKQAASTARPRQSRRGQAGQQGHARPAEVRRSHQG